MRVTKNELRGLVAENETYFEAKGEHPTAFLSDDLFNRILEDLHKLAGIEDGQKEMWNEAEINALRKRLAERRYFTETEEIAALREEIGRLKTTIQDVRLHAVLVSGTVPNDCPNREALVEKIQAIGEP